jgi:isopenicillin N synthase-like dioxygenase
MPQGFDRIPVIDVTPLFEPGGSAERVDREIGRACEESGFLIIRGAAIEALCPPERLRRLLAFFTLDEAARRPLARRRYVPENANIYRGYFPVTDGELTYKEGIDIGPEFAPGDPGYPLDDPLIERNPWPAESALPGWRAEVMAYYRDMLGLGRVLMHAIARYLGLREDWFDPFFAASNSTLRLLRYPVRTARSLEGVEEAAFLEHDGRRLPIMAKEHVDSGILTLLRQDSVGGLQARNAAGKWIDVPPIAGSYVVNLGGALQRWTNDRFVATPHRVLGNGAERHSVPFFFEPSVDAVIECVPSPAGDPPRYAPVRYGDYLVEAMQRFVETRGVAA